MAATGSPGWIWASYCDGRRCRPDRDVGEASVSVVRASSGAGVRIPVLAPGTGPGAGRIDFPFGVAPEVFFLE